MTWATVCGGLPRLGVRDTGRPRSPRGRKIGGSLPERLAAPISATGPKKPVLFTRRAAPVVALALCIVALAGCRPEEEVRTYRIAKPADAPSAASETPQPIAPETAAKPPSGEPTDRMIGSIVPGPSQAWFFKAVGPKAAIDDAADAVTAFLASVRFDGDKPKWETPEGWTEEEAGGMRLATLKVPAEEGTESIEMSVIGLPLVGDWDAQVLDNANRWRKQLQQPPLAAEAIGDELKPLADVAEGAVLFDTVGWFDGGTMAPFAGGAAPFANATPPAAPAAPAAEQREMKYQSELQSTTPDGWTEEPGSAMRKASLRTPGGAVLTGFAFPLTGAMGDRLENVNRWRGEIGLEPTTAEELEAQTEEMKLLGSDGAYFEMVGKTETTHAAMVEREGQVWFFKLRGPVEEVANERDAFKKWLESLSLEGAEK